MLNIIFFERLAKSNINALQKKNSKIEEINIILK